MTVQGYNFNSDEPFREDGVYQWFAASGDDNAVVQVVRPEAGLSEIELKAVADYFEKLVTVDKDGVLVPKNKIKPTDSKYRLVLAYPEIQGTSVQEYLDASPASAQNICSDICERLHALQTCGVVHGFPALESFVVIDEQVCLSFFGYAPLIEAHRKDILDRRSSLLAPEVLRGEKPTERSDIYTLAKSMGEWKAQFRESDWYRKATDPTPRNRHRRFRDLQSEIVRDFKRLESPVVLPRTTGGLLQKHKLSLEVQPAGAGQITCSKSPVGDGNIYVTDGQSVKLEASPSGASWRFDKWEGDARGTGNPVQLAMDCEKKVIARFIGVRTGPDPVPRSRRVRVTARIKPTGAGSITGVGTYDSGKDVELEARPAPEYTFKSWSGMSREPRRDNPIRLTLESDVEVVAEFIKTVAPRRKAKVAVCLLLLIGCPSVLLPVMSGATALLALWAFTITSALAVFAAVTCFAIALGILLTRAIFLGELLDKLERAEGPSSWL